MASSVLQFVCVCMVSSHQLVVAMQICIHFSLPAVPTDPNKKWTITNLVGIFGFCCQISLSEVTMECTTKTEVQEQCVKCRHVTKENELRHCWSGKCLVWMWFESWSSDFNQFQCTLSMPSFRCSYLNSQVGSNLFVFSKLLRLSLRTDDFPSPFHGPHTHNPRLGLHTHQSPEPQGWQKAWQETGQTS